MSANEPAVGGLNDNVDRVDAAPMAMKITVPTAMGRNTTLLVGYAARTRTINTRVYAAIAAEMIASLEDRRET